MRRGAKPSLPPIARAEPPLPDRQRRRGLNDIFTITTSKSHQDSSKHLLIYYETSAGTIQHLLKDLMVDAIEQRAWLAVWTRLDGDRTNRLSFIEFCEIFQISKNYDWTRRVFDMINKKLTGYISLDELFIFCLEYLIVDAEATRLFCFRLLSRRAGTSDAQTILDMQDMKTFIKFAYKIKSTHADKIASEIFTEMDKSGDYGLAFEEFCTYSIRNPTFLAFGNMFLTHFRVCLFGYDFWVKKSRKIKKSKAVGFGSFVRLKYANIESETLAKKLMKRGSLNNKATKSKHKDSSKDFKDNYNKPSGVAAQSNKKSTRVSKTTPSDAAQHISDDNTTSPELPPIDETAQEAPTVIQSTALIVATPLSFPAASPSRRGSSLAFFTGSTSGPGQGKRRRTSILDLFQKKKDPDAPKVGIGPDGTVSEEYYDEDDDDDMEESDESRRARLEALVFRDTLFDYIKLSSGSFERDFGDVVMSRQMEKNLKVQNKLQFMKEELAKESRTYALMTMALDDLVHQRRGKRIAFCRWLDAVDMESTRQEGYRSEATERKRKEAESKKAASEMDTDTFVLTAEDEFKLHARIMELTSHLRQNGADEEVFNEYHLAYNSANHKAAFLDNDRTARLRESMVGL